MEKECQINKRMKYICKTEKQGGEGVCLCSQKLTGYRTLPTFTEKARKARNIHYFLNVNLFGKDRL